MKNKSILVMFAVLLVGCVSSPRPPATYSDLEEYYGSQLSKLPRLEGGFEVYVRDQEFPGFEPSNREFADFAVPRNFPSVSFARVLSLKVSAIYCDYVFRFDDAEVLVSVTKVEESCSSAQRKESAQ